MDSLLNYKHGHFSRAIALVDGCTPALGDKFQNLERRTVGLLECANLFDSFLEKQDPAIRHART
jgi:hypothetical protein